jgi:hypothetical protein
MALVALVTAAKTTTTPVSASWTESVAANMDSAVTVEVTVARAVSLCMVIARVPPLLHLRVLVLPALSGPPMGNAAVRPTLTVSAMSMASAVVNMVTVVLLRGTADQDVKVPLVTAIHHFLRPRALT